jgi:hypothetical protein
VDDRAVQDHARSTTRVFLCEHARQSSHFEIFDHRERHVREIFDPNALEKFTEGIVGLHVAIPRRSLHLAAGDAVRHPRAILDDQIVPGVPRRYGFIRRHVSCQRGQLCECVRWQPAPQFRPARRLGAFGQCVLDRALSAQRRLIAFRA